MSELPTRSASAELGAQYARTLVTSTLQCFTNYRQPHIDDALEIAFALFDEIGDLDECAHVIKQMLLELSGFAASALISEAQARGTDPFAMWQELIAANEA